MRGHCLCKLVTLKSSSQPQWQGFCHCESCRRATSGPVVAWMGFNKDTVTFSTPPKVFVSSEGVERGFCGDCGSPLFFKSEKWPDEIHLYGASLDGPQDFTPEAHYFFSEKLTCFLIDDMLPKSG